MTAYENRPERRIGIGALAGAGLSAAARAAARNPVAVGGTTAFLVALSFVSANAVWYQPQSHPSAFVSTREQAIAIPEPQPAPSVRQDVRQAVPNTTPRPELSPTEPESTGSIAPGGGDATVRSVQSVLQELGLYDGPIDGMSGPQTNEAVENYRRIVDLQPGHEIDSDLLRQLGLEEQSAAMPTPPAPTPAPRPRPVRNASGTAEMASDAADEARDRMQAAPDVQTSPDVQTASLSQADPTVRRVQAGLKAFGNDGIEVDGVLGENTRDAIREFQSLFGLKVTGKPDQEFLAKMREVGLIN